MFRILILFLILNFYNQVQASTKNKIIFKLEQINNLSFYFKQTINEKNEKGYCTIKYPKKIYCAYKNTNKKIIVSNGKSLVIKNRSSGTYYMYPLNKTPFEFLLDKNYLIEKINNLESKEIENEYIYFEILENNNKINIFFDKKTFNLIGWQTEDIYQNLVITFISSIEINQKINDRIFILPKRN